MIFSYIFKVLPQHETLRRLIWMRAIALISQLWGVVVAQFWLGIDLPLLPLLTIMLLLAAFNAWTWKRMQQTQPVGEIGLFTQLFIDVLTLSSLLYFSGGATNPFVSFYLPALAVAAAILPWRFALALALFSLTCYSIMTSVYIPLRIPDPDRAVNYHLTGMWANFTLSTGLITWFVARMSSALRERDAQLAQAREQHLRNERIVALGTQAASAAHEMGTPLSTIAVIANDLRHETKQNASLATYSNDLATIEAQIALCKASLDRMSTQADAEAAPPAAVVDLDKWLQQFIGEWRLRYPAIKMELSLPLSGARIARAPIVGQILLTLLDNAAQATAGKETPISVSLSMEYAFAAIQVKDHGPGISPELLNRLGYEPVDSISGGQGIGLMLAFTAARQIDATITLSSGRIEGTVSTLTVPLA